MKQKKAELVEGSIVALVIWAIAVGVVIGLALLFRDEITRTLYSMLGIR